MVFFGPALLVYFGPLTLVYLIVIGLFWPHPGLRLAFADWAKKCALLEHISALRVHLGEVETIHDFEGMEPANFICSCC